MQFTRVLTNNGVLLALVLQCFAMLHYQGYDFNDEILMDLIFSIPHDILEQLWYLHTYLQTLASKLTLLTGCARHHYNCHTADIVAI
jgi:hypothetical protein